MHKSYCHMVRRSNNNIAASAAAEDPTAPSFLIHPNLPPDVYQEVFCGVCLRCPFILGREFLTPPQCDGCRIGGGPTPLHLTAPLCSHVLHKLLPLLYDPLTLGGIVPSHLFFLAPPPLPEPSTSLSSSSLSS